MDKHLLLKHLHTIITPLIHLIGKCAKSVNGVYPDVNGNIQIKVGGDQTQADWGENDDSAVTYVKNRTHYETFGMKTILEDTALTLQAAMQGLYMYILPSYDVPPPFPIETLPDIGAKCTVRFAGNTYESEAVAVPEIGDAMMGNPDFPFIGNVSLLGAMMGAPDGYLPDTGEPFVILFQMDQETQTYGAAMLATIEGETLGIYTPGMTYKPLNAEYLPRDGSAPYPLKKELSAVATSGEYADLKGIPGAVVVVTADSGENTDMTAEEVAKKAKAGSIVLLRIPSVTSGNYVIATLVGYSSSSAMFSAYTYENAITDITLYRLLGSKVEQMRRNEFDNGITINGLRNLRVMSSGGNGRHFVIAITDEGIPEIQGGETGEFGVVKWTSAPVPFVSKTDAGKVLTAGEDGAWKADSTLKTTVEAAKTTAEAAKTSADAAISTANNAKETAEKALSKDGGFVGKLSVYDELLVKTKDNAIGANLILRPKKDAPNEIWVGRDISDDPTSPATLKFMNNSGRGAVNLAGIGSITMESADGKEFKVTVDDDGNISAGNSTIELIETITLTEDMAVERSAEPDGTPYSFKRIVLMFEVAAEATAAAGNIYFYSGGTGVGLGYLARKDASSSVSYLMNDCGPDAGRWLARYMGGWTGNGNGVYANNENRRRWLQYAVKDYPTLTRIAIPTLPAGTRIEIWGVRVTC